MGRYMQMERFGCKTTHIKGKYLGNDDDNNIYSWTADKLKELNSLQTDYKQLLLLENDISLWRKRESKGKGKEGGNQKRQKRKIKERPEVMIDG